MREGHYFEPMSERYPLACLRCRRVEEVHPPCPDVPRDLEEEAALKKYALSLAPHVHPLVAQRLSQLSHERADRGPIRGLDTRDFYEDTAEEISDEVNYTIWNIRQVDRRDGDHTEERMALVAYLIGLYEQWEKLQIAKQARRPPGETS
jgi:hypothetical protein